MKITVKNTSKDKPLINPHQMYNAGEGKIFQQYHNGKPTQDYYINAGLNEPLIQIWWNQDSRSYCLSSSSLKDLYEFYDTVKVKEIDATLSIELKIND